jgi:hypothetical protein
MQRSIDLSKQTNCPNGTITEAMPGIFPAAHLDQASQPIAPFTLSEASFDGLYSLVLLMR